MEVLKQATLLPEEQKQFLESINYETKLFQKTNMGDSYCPQNLSEAQAKVIRTRSLICDKFPLTKETSQGNRPRISCTSKQSS